MLLLSSREESMAKPKDGITPIKRRAIQLRLEGKSWTDISRALNITTEAIWHWRRDPKFQELLVSTEEAIFAETSFLHNKYVKDAFACLHRMAVNQDNKFSETIQQNAAVKLIELTHRNIEVIKVVENNRLTLNKYYAQNA